ncbi:hypothetical protein LCGC14_2050270, partial [marine sediment metagenome]
MENALIVDLETQTPGTKPDFRYDTITQVGWLPLDGDTAYWSECVCPMPMPSAFICHNAMYDVGILFRLQNPDYARRWLKGINIHDTMALAYCAGATDLSLPKQVSWKQRDTIGEEQYLAQDLFETRDYFNRLMDKNEGTAYEVDRRLIPALIDCSYRGYEIDQDRLEQSIWEGARTCNLQRGLFDRLVGGEEVLISRRKKTTKARGVEYVEKHGPPDIGSPKQLARLFGWPDTTKERLQAAIGEDIRVDTILTWRGASKEFSTYQLPLREMEYLSGLFNITPPEEGEGGATTGRLSSERRNMQNLSPAIQRCLRAPDGYLLRRGDFPRLELRCAAQI